jgi:hypothetical protein
MKTYKIFTDVTAPKEEVTVGPAEGMVEFESRKLWGMVSRGIREGDYETASREKSKIEVGTPPNCSVWCAHLVIIERSAPTKEGRGRGRYNLATEALCEARV